MNKHSFTFLFAIFCIGCNAEHGTPYPIEAIYGGPPPQITKRNPDGTTALVYIATPKEIKKAVEQQDWHDPENDSIVLLTRGGDKRDKCQLTGSTSPETRPLQFIYFGNERLIAQVDSLDEAISVLTLFLEDDPQWNESVEWQPMPEED